MLPCNPLATTGVGIYQTTGKWHEQIVYSIQGILNIMMTRDTVIVDSAVCYKKECACINCSVIASAWIGIALFCLGLYVHRFA